MVIQRKHLTKDQAAQELIEWHFQVEPGLERVLRILSDDESSPEEPIKLLEVTTGTVPTGRVEPYLFGPTPECPYKVSIAEVTPEEFDAACRDPGLLPMGWRLETAEITDRRRAA